MKTTTPKETNADILLTLGIDTSSLTGLRQTIQAELSKHNFSISITGLDQKNLTDTANQLKQINTASESLNKAQLATENARLKLEEKRLELLNKREEKTKKINEEVLGPSSPTSSQLKKVVDDEKDILSHANAGKLEIQQEYESEKMRRMDSDSKIRNSAWVRELDNEKRIRQKNYDDLVDIDKEFNDKLSDNDWNMIKNRGEITSRLSDINDKEIADKSIADSNAYEARQKSDTRSAELEARRLERESRDINKRKAMHSKGIDDWIANDNKISQKIQAQATQQQAPSLVPKSAHVPESEFLVALKWASIYTLMYTGIRTAKAAVIGLGQAMIEVDEAAILLQRDLKLTSDQMQHGLKVAMEEAASMGQRYGQSMTDVIMVQDRFAKQGMSLPDIFKATEATLVGASTSLMTTADTAQFLSVVMKAFKLNTNDAMSVMDKLNEVSKNYNITAQDLALALQHTGSSARLVGMSIDETIGVITAIAEATGRSGAEIGNSVRTMTSFIYRPDTIKALEGMKFAVKDASDKGFRPFIDILGDIAKRWKTLNDVEQETIVNVIGGTLRREQLLSVMEGYDTVQKSTTTSANSFLSALKEQRIMMDDVGFKYRQLTSDVQSMAKAFGDLGPIYLFKKALDSAGWAASVLSMTVKGIGVVVQSWALANKTFMNNMSAEAELASNRFSEHFAKASQFASLVNKSKEITTEKEISNLRDQAVILYDLYHIDKSRLSIANTKVALEKELESTANKIIDIAPDEFRSMVNDLGSLKGQIELQIKDLERIDTSSRNEKDQIMSEIRANQLLLDMIDRAMSGGVQQLTAEYNLIKDFINNPPVPKPDLHSKEWDQLQIQLDKLKEKSKEIKWDITPNKKEIEDEQKRLNVYLSKLADIDEADRKAKEKGKLGTEDKAQSELRKKDRKDLKELIDKSTDSLNLFNKEAIVSEHSLEMIKAKSAHVYDNTKTFTENLVATTQGVVSNLESEMKLIEQAWKTPESELTNAQKVLLETKHRDEVASNLNDARFALLKAELALQKEQQTSTRMQYLSKLDGLSEEKILLKERDRLIAEGPRKAKEAEEMNWRAFEARTNKILALSEKMTDGIAGTIVNMFDTSKIRQPLAEFGNTFKGIFAEVMKQQLVESLMPKMNEALGMKEAIAEGSLLMRNAIVDGAVIAAGILKGTGNMTSLFDSNGKQIATPANFSPATNNVTSGTEGSWWTKYGGTVATLGMTGIQAIQSQQAGVKNAWAPLLGAGIGAIAGGPVGAMIGGMIGGLFTKPKKSQPTPVQEPMLEVIHRDLEYVNRNLIAMKKPLEMYALPASYYFSARPAGGVHNQNISVTVYAADGKDAGTQISGILARNSRMAFQGV